MASAPKSTPDGLVIRWHANFFGEEVANSIIHGIGLLLAILGAVPLLQKARSSDDRGYLIGSALYVTGLVGFYLAATLRHSLFFLESTGRIMHTIDRSAIFLLIAGTYTPFTVVNLSGRALGRIVLVATWVCCALGIAVSTATGRRYRRLKLFLYLGMGWIGAVSMNDVMQCVKPQGLLLLLGGGAIYTVAALAYWRERSLPGYSKFHGVWYAFVLGASLLHYTAVFNYVLVEPGCGIGDTGPVDAPSSFAQVFQLGLPALLRDFL